MGSTARGWLTASVTETRIGTNVRQCASQLMVHIRAATKFTQWQLHVYVRATWWQVFCRWLLPE